MFIIVKITKLLHVSNKIRIFLCSFKKSGRTDRQRTSAGGSGPLRGLPSMALSDERWFPSFYFLTSFCENPLSCSILRCCYRQP